jgi:hypothetical protein
MQKPEIKAHTKWNSSGRDENDTSNDTLPQCAAAGARGFLLASLRLPCQGASRPGTQAPIDYGRAPPGGGGGMLARSVPWPLG